MMALLLACVCHDADHRGYSNTYAKASTSLGALYKSSVMESHHYSTAAAVMRRPKHDVLSELSSKERKEVTAAHPGRRRDADVSESAACTLAVTKIVSSPAMSDMDKYLGVYLCFYIVLHYSVPLFRVSLTRFAPL